MWSGRCVRDGVGVDGQSGHLGWIVDVEHRTNKQSQQGLSVATMSDDVEPPQTPMRGPLFMRKLSLSYVFCFLISLD